VLQWRLVGKGEDNPQILARDPQGGLLTVNRVKSMRQPDKWWLTWRTPRSRELGLLIL
jgi:hypothetical protein